MKKNPIEPVDVSERPSKSQRKKEMLALQHIGEVLVSLPPSELAQIPLPDSLADAVSEAQKIHDHEGKRRQLQYVGKLMRNVDAAPIEEALAKVQSKHQATKASFHHIEKWRDKLIAEGDVAVEEFIKKFPQCEAQPLRQLIRKVQADQKENKNSGAGTSLFRYLREVMDPS